MSKTFARSVAVVATMLSALSCSTLECPLNNAVRTNIRLGGAQSAVEDTLSVSALRFDGQDTLLINRSVEVDSLLVPMSYGQNTDELRFTWATKAGTTISDTVRITKTNEPHFESVDCNATFFHTLESIETTHNAIDSIAIKKTFVDYDATSSHIIIYLRERY